MTHRPFSIKSYAALAAILTLLLSAATGCSRDVGSDSVRFSLCLVQYNESPMSEDTRQGIIEGLKASGLTQGTDYSLKIQNAQGDVSTLNSIMDMANFKDYRLVMVSSTPTLQAALNKIKKAPIVFTTVADPVAAGAGQSFENHQPRVTGISTLGDYEGMVKILAQLQPRPRRIGTLFVPGEINSVVNKDHLVKFAAAAGMQVEALPVSASSEVSNAAQALVRKNIDAVCQVICNMTDEAFPAIARAADQKKIPVFAFNSNLIDKGVVAVVARDYIQAGRDGAAVAVRILRGEDPAMIPFSLVSKSNFIINRQQADKLGVVFPEALQKEADRIVGAAQR